MEDRFQQFRTIKHTWFKYSVSFGSNGTRGKTYDIEHKDRNKIIADINGFHQVTVKTYLDNSHSFINDMWYRTFNGTIYDISADNRYEYGSNIIWHWQYETIIIQKYCISC